MDGELFTFTKVWISAIISLCCCYYVASNIPKGLLRLFSILPIIFLFFILPLNLSCIHLCGPTAFYLVWLGNFKLILFSFGQGPLSSQPKLSLFHFVSIGLLPIKPKQDPSLQSSKNAKVDKKPSTTLHPLSDLTQKVGNQGMLVAKMVLLGVIIRIYDYRADLHPFVILALYCSHVYLAVELVLAFTATPFQVILGFEIEPQFDEPYLATSLQDFWGRRWNLMVTSILRPTVYNPVRRVTAPKFGKLRSALLAIIASFLMSGLMHEIIYYYLTRVRPTWEVTCFFVLQGVCTAIEVAMKRAVDGRFRLHWAVSGPLTIGFVWVTASWLFYPQIIRNGVDLNAIKEYKILVDFVRDRLSI